MINQSREKLILDNNVNNLTVFATDDNYVWKFCIALKIYANSKLQLVTTMEK